jgi:Acetyltransferase (GNAT) domain
MAKGGYAVRLFEPELAEACDRFIQRVWPRSDEPGASTTDRTTTRPPRVLFLKEQEVIGHVATTPVRLAVRGRLRDASWAVGLVVLPEHRNGPVAPLLMKKLNEAVDIGLTLHVEEAALRVFTGVGWRHVGVLPQYVRVLRARPFVTAFAGRGHRFLPGRWARLWRWLGAAAGPVSAGVGAGFTALAVAGAVCRRRAVGVTVAEEHGFDPGYTALAERVKDKLGVWVFRDERYLAARYGARPGAYRLLAARGRDGLLGYGLLKIRQFEDDPRMGDIRMGTLVDCVFDPDQPAVLDALLGAAIATCRRERVDVVFCAASLRALRARLRRHAFLEMPGTLNVAFHDRTQALADAPPLDAWHLMRGDSDADANC